MLTAFGPSLVAQAQKNSEDRFAMCGFKDAFMDVVSNARSAQNSIADQMLKDLRTWAIMQRMLVKMVWKGFQQPGARG